MDTNILLENGTNELEVLWNLHLEIITMVFTLAKVRGILSYQPGNSCAKFP